MMMWDLTITHFMQISFLTVNQIIQFNPEIDERVALLPGNPSTAAEIDQVAEILTNIP
jgi:hypothetical protein